MNQSHRRGQRTDLLGLVGEWSGTSQLWLEPGSDARVSQHRVSVERLAAPGFCSMRYTWSDEGQPQDGELIIAMQPQKEATDIVWVDSWHTAGQMMLFRDDGDDREIISALGSYSVGDGPAWGWRITLSSTGPDDLQLRMYNITPDGQSMLAVETLLSRAVSQG